MRLTQRVPIGAGIGPLGPGNRPRASLATFSLARLGHKQSKPLSGLTKPMSTASLSYHDSILQPRRLTFKDPNGLQPIIRLVGHAV